MIININVAVRVAALALSFSRFFNYGTRRDSLIYIYILFFRQNFSFPFVLSYFLFLIIIIFRILERLNYSHAYNSAIPIYFQTSRKCHSRPWNFIGPIISRHARLPTLALRRFDTNSSPKKKRCFSPFRVKYRHIYTCIYIYIVEQTNVSIPRIESSSTTLHLAKCHRFSKRSIVPNTVRPIRFLSTPRVTTRG